MKYLEDIKMDYTGIGMIVFFTQLRIEEVIY